MAETLTWIREMQAVRRQKTLSSTSCFLKGGVALLALLLFLLVNVLAMPVQANAEGVKKILSIEAQDMLNTVPDTYLLDVRTRAEYQFVGHPVGAYLFPYLFYSNTLITKEDECHYDFGEKNKHFVEEIAKLFKKTDNLLVISRDGTRSVLAAKDLAEAGFKNVYDVEDGFEGPPFPTFKDSNRDKFYRQLARRNKVVGFDLRRHYGWQWWGLPWTYHMDPKYVYPPDLTPAKK
jgi:rhodanese-related sulfurtransferase